MLLVMILASSDDVVKDNIADDVDDTVFDSVYTW